MPNSGARPNVVHTVPTVGRAHRNDGFDCWCGPSYSTPCDECGGHDQLCWKCGGSGLLDVESPATHDGPFGIIVLHKVEAP